MPLQTELLASCASDRSIILYDMRESTPLKKVLTNLVGFATAAFF